MSDMHAIYDWHPRVVRVSENAHIRIRARYAHGAFKLDASYEVVIAERDTRRQRRMTVKAAASGLNVSFAPESEQEYVLLVKASGDERSPVLSFPVYAVAEDLSGCRAWKGDFHIHSECSDGKESPAYVGAACRQQGFDFMALTDHRQYEPSLEVIRTFAQLDLDFGIFPGEEVHPPDNPVHMVNFGGKSSINAAFSDGDAYELGVQRLLATAPGNLLPQERRTYASCAWVFEQIRAGGGVGILCHPYWLTGEAYNISEALQAAFYEHLPFDALEVIGGYYRYQMESNALAVARWQQERAAGRRMPVVGVSDAHGCDRDLFGWYYTIVFSPTLAFTELRQAILAENCVAVEAVPGEFPRVSGPFRLVKFAYFLLREVFQEHDALCCEEGILMKRFLEGDSTVESRIAAQKGAVREYLDRIWGTPG